MAAGFYDEIVCCWSRRGENSLYKCRQEECKHHACHIPNYQEIEFYEWNPFGKTPAWKAPEKCPLYKTKLQMVAQNRRGDGGGD